MACSLAVRWEHWYKKEFWCTRNMMKTCTKYEVLYPIFFKVSMWVSGMLSVQYNVLEYQSGITYLEMHIRLFLSGEFKNYDNRRISLYFWSFFFFCSIFNMYAWNLFDEINNTHKHTSDYAWWLIILTEILI